MIDNFSVIKPLRVILSIYVFDITRARQINLVFSKKNYSPGIELHEGNPFARTRPYGYVEKAYRGVAIMVRSVFQKKKTISPE